MTNKIRRVILPLTLIVRRMAKLIIPMIVQTLHGVTSKFIISMVYLHRIKKRLLMSIFTRSKMHTLNKMVGLRRLRQFGSPLNILVL